MSYLLKREGLTMDDFHYEIKKLTRIRKAIPKPDENTLMRKVITEDVAIVVDTKHLKTIEGTIIGLRLDYEKTLKLDNLVIPIDSRFTSEYPFTRNGFTSGNNGRLGVPEYVLDKRVSPKIGAEIWRIKPDGTEELIAIFEKEQEKFVRIKK